MATTFKSKKAKGKRAEIEFAKLLRDKGIDKEAQRMPLSGAIDYLKGDIYAPNLPHDKFEVKNTERVKIWQFIEQAEAEASFGETPHLIITSNNRPLYVVMRAGDWADLKKLERDFYANS